MPSQPTYKQFLTSELARRQAKNPRYSLRTFARAIRVSPGNLSRVLSDKAMLSVATVRGICDALGLSGSEQRPLFTPAEIDTNVYDQIADWYHYAILELTFVEDFRSDPKWIARALNLTDKPEARP